MVTKTRLATKTIWALEDVQAWLLAAGEVWSDAMEVAERRLDPVMMQKLARLRHALAEMERLVRDARAGEYRGRR